MNYGKKSSGNTVKLNSSAKPTGGIFKNSSGLKSKSIRFKNKNRNRIESERKLRLLRKNLRKELSSSKVQDYYKNKEL